MRDKIFDIIAMRRHRQHLLQPAVNPPADLHGPSLSGSNLLCQRHAWNGEVEVAPLCGVQNDSQSVVIACHCQTESGDGQQLDAELKERIFSAKDVSDSPVHSNSRGGGG